MIRIPFDEVKNQLVTILLSRNCPEEKARMVAFEMARNSLEGTYTHGVNRFARLIRNIDEGIVKPDAEPEKLRGFGAIENYDGKLGLGIVNAHFAMGRAIDLARLYGIAMVAMRNTNHWLRAATYGYQACHAGMAALCFSNTMPNMPTWGAVDTRLGNNPLCLAIPGRKGPVVVDMAMSQYSYGALEKARLAGTHMQADAGYDTRGLLSRDPEEILKSGRVLPMGYWKGAGLSFLLDAFAGCFSLGRMVAGVGRQEGDEHGVSQVFMAVNFHEIAPENDAGAILDDAIAYLLDSKRDEHTARIAVPGQRAREAAAENRQLGIPVDERVWREIKHL